MVEFLKNIDQSWTLFLDRDGVVNERVFGGYVQNWEGFHILPGVLDSMAVFARHFGRIIMVTNQQGVGKGLMDEEILKHIHNQLRVEVEQAGGRLDAIYYCPDLESKVGNCRKPGIAMALQARHDFPEIDFSKSIMVGDSISDMEFGLNAGMFTVFVGDRMPEKFSTDLRVSGLAEFSLLIKKYNFL